MTRPKKLLTQNSELRRHGIYNWTLPAFAVRLTDGSTFNVCPNAGACATFCYARNGTYLFSNVKARHIANLEYTLEDPAGWQAQMLAEVQAPKMAGRYVRIHDSGDFYSLDYLKLWLTIAEQTPAVVFYAYTKEVAMFQRYEQTRDWPANFRYLFSMGGKQDHLIDLDNHRHADVFPDEAAIEAAGYVSQDESDLLAITIPGTRIGIPANNIRAFNKRMAGRTFSELQIERNTKHQQHIAKEQ
jgi:hypothetical protein